MGAKGTQLQAQFPVVMHIGVGLSSIWDLHVLVRICICRYHWWPLSICVCIVFYRLCKYVHGHTRANGDLVILPDPVAACTQVQCASRTDLYQHLINKTPSVMVKLPFLHLAEAIAVGSLLLAYHDQYYCYY